MSLLINEAKQGGLIFSLEACEDAVASIVVEVPTQNEPIYYGAGDIRNKNNRVKTVTATAKSVIIEKENGDVFAAPVHLSGKYKARIYQFGDDAHAWTWKRGENGEAIIEPEKRL